MTIEEKVVTDETTATNIKPSIIRIYGTKPKVEVVEVDASVIATIAPNIIRIKY